MSNENFNVDQMNDEFFAFIILNRFISGLNSGRVNYHIRQCDKTEDMYFHRDYVLTTKDVNCSIGLDPKVKCMWTIDNKTVETKNNKGFNSNFSINNTLIYDDRFLCPDLFSFFLRNFNDGHSYVLTARFDDVLQYCRPMNRGKYHLVNIGTLIENNKIVFACDELGNSYSITGLKEKLNKEK